MPLNMEKITTLSFDCYGTLIDWESGIWDGFQPLLCANASMMTRHMALESFASIESAVQAETPGLIYPQILREVHRRFAATHGFEDSAEIGGAAGIGDSAEIGNSAEMAGRFGDFVPFWPAFPDSADALRRLAKKFRLVILSNVDRAGFAASARRLGVVFDAVYTAEDIGSYKPDGANFRHMLTRLAEDHATPPDAILHVAQSLFHDIAPAQDFGLQTAWIDRQNLKGGGSWGATAKIATSPGSIPGAEPWAMPGANATFPTLMDFAEVVCDE